MLNGSDILRGYTDTIILAQLFRGDSYGYSINRRVQEVTGGELQLKEGTLYTTFRRLEDAGFIGIRMEKRKITGKILSPYRTEKGKFSSNPTDKEVYAEEFVLTGRKPDHE